MERTLLLIFLVSITTALTPQQQERLILSRDAENIDEKLRELPGGVLLPPEIENDGIQFDKFERVQRHNERLKSVVKSIRRLQTYNKQHSPSRKLFTPLATRSDTLEISLKRIEILAARAGFNMSSIPRRSQLQIVTKLADKLPEKLRTVVKSALKSNDVRIYEFLPEPSRDPLIEDNPSFLASFLSDEVKDDFGSYEKKENNKDSSLVSITTDGEKPSHYGYEDHSFPDLQSDVSEIKEKRVKFEETIPTALKSEERDSKSYDNHKEEIKITRSQGPIRVSIISKDDSMTTESPKSTKFVQVADFQNKTNLLFQVEKEVNEPDYDLSSSEIAAMVSELAKYENSVELGPSELEFPDHPDHKDELELEIERIIKRKQEVPKVKNFRRPLPPQRPIRPPMRLNNVKVSEIPEKFDRECDYFSGEVCLLVQDYPIEAISDAVSSLSSPSSLLPPEDPSETNSPSKLSSEGGFLCPSKVAYGKIKKAKSSTTKKWKFIVNYGDKTQTLRMEKCLTPGDKCSYVMPHYRTACTQVYNYHRLLAWDEDVGLHLDTFKVPSVCTCHVMGYYANNKNPQSPAINPQRRRMQLPPPPHHHHHRRPPPHQFLQPRPQPRIQKPQQQNEDDLDALLKQYQTLKEKISKKKDTSLATERSSRLLKKQINLIDTILLRKKRKNSSKPENLKKLLKKIKQKNKSFDKKKVLEVAKRQIKSFKLKKLKKRTRIGKSMKSSMKSKHFLKIVQRINELKKKGKKNFSYHPIMEYIK